MENFKSIHNVTKIENSGISSNIDAIGNVTAWTVIEVTNANGEIFQLNLFATNEANLEIK